jgi:hypothetical protein
MKYLRRFNESNLELPYEKITWGEYHSLIGNVGEDYNCLEIPQSQFKKIEKAFKDKSSEVIVETKPVSDFIKRIILEFTNLWVYISLIEDEYYLVEVVEFDEFNDDCSFTYYKCDTIEWTIKTY